MTPLSGILSMKPSLKYLDKSDKTARAEGRPKLNESSQDEEEEDESATVQKIGVRFLKGSASEADKSMRKKSFEYQQKKADEEPWIPMDYHHVKSDKWVEQTHKLFCRHQDEVSFNGDEVKVDQYLEELRNSS